jgi:hypothetical protein
LREQPQGEIEQMRVRGRALRAQRCSGVKVEPVPDGEIRLQQRSHAGNQRLQRTAQFAV